MPLQPKNSDTIELFALRESGVLGRLGPYNADIYGFEYSLLPDEAKRVIQLIIDGAPLPFPEHDGKLFSNRASDLPGNPVYREFTVPTPGVDHRGKRRLVIKDNGMVFFTACHYDRVPGKSGTPQHAVGMAEIDPQWQHGFYVVTGIPPGTRSAIAIGIRKIHNSRLPVLKL